MILTALNEFKTIRSKIFAEKLIKLALSFQFIWLCRLFEMTSLSQGLMTVDWSLFSWMMPWMKLWIGLLPLIPGNLVGSLIFSQSGIVLKSQNKQQWNWNRFRKILNRNQLLQTVLLIIKFQSTMKVKSASITASHLFGTVNHINWLKSSVTCTRLWSLLTV